ncbi:hypothetical protein [Streptomyces sp. NPDC088350]
MRTRPRRSALTAAAFATVAVLAPASTVVAPVAAGAGTGKL